MVYDLIIRPQAEAELSDAFNWYEDQVSGLGSEYLNAIEAALFAIKRNPETYPTIHGAIRRCLIRRFPYAIFYCVEASCVVVLAVFHVRRKPADWKKRR